MRSSVQDDCCQQAHPKATRRRRDKMWLPFPFLSHAVGSSSQYIQLPALMQVDIAPEVRREYRTKVTESWGNWLTSAINALDPWGRSSYPEDHSHRRPHGGYQGCLHLLIGMCRNFGHIDRSCPFQKVTQLRQEANLGSWGFRRCSIGEGSNRLVLVYSVIP